MATFHYFCLKSGFSRACLVKLLSQTWSCSELLTSFIIFFVAKYFSGHLPPVYLTIMTTTPRLSGFCTRHTLTSHSFLVSIHSLVYSETTLVLFPHGCTILRLTNFVLSLLLSVFAQSCENNEADNSITAY